jgi:dTDP-4-amino-4,6-dideoxygalactose transaminase
MERLDAYVARRHALAQRYDEQLADLPLVRPWQNPEGYSALHLYVVRLDLNRIRAGRLQVFEALRAQGIGVNLHYIPVHTQPFYERLGFRRGQYPDAERYYAEAISLPMYPTLSEEQQDSVLQALREVALA